MPRNNADFESGSAPSCAICGELDPQVHVGGFNNLKFCSKEHALQAMTKSYSVAKSLDKMMGGE